MGGEGIGATGVTIFISSCFALEVKFKERSGCELRGGGRKWPIGLSWGFTVF